MICYFLPSVSQSWCLVDKKNVAYCFTFCYLFANKTQGLCSHSSSHSCYGDVSAVSPL